MICEARNTPSSRPSTTFAPEVRNVDEGVDEAGDELRLLEEPHEVVEADELDLEQRPAGEREVERRDGRDEEQHDVEDAGGDEEPVG